MSPFERMRKAESGLRAVQMLLQSKSTLDTACFHAQQAAEKYLKAYLIAWDIDFPFTYDLRRLPDLCEERDDRFSALVREAETLTPYAVELRYDISFWPSQERAEDAHDAALTAKRLVVERLPPDVRTVDTA
jgi:HEPN domain-containing protein